MKAVVRVIPAYARKASPDNKPLKHCGSLFGQSRIVIKFDNLDQNKPQANRCSNFRSRDLNWGKAFLNSIGRTMSRRFSPHFRESMTVLDSGFHAVDSGFQHSGFRIPKWAGFQFFFGFNAFLRISFSCSNLAILKDVVRMHSKFVFFFDL